jgi:CTP:molybdopterin cytidylyltransferase MocA
LPEHGAWEPSSKPKVGRYANAFRVGFNAFEVVIEFGEQFSDAGEARMHTRVITNPICARGLVDSLTDALAKYGDAFSTPPP